MNCIYLNIWNFINSLNDIIRFVRLNLIIMIKIFYRFSTRVVTTDLDSLKLFRKFYSWKPNKIYAFYNS